MSSISNDASHDLLIEDHLQPDIQEFFKYCFKDSMIFLPLQDIEVVELHFCRSICFTTTTPKLIFMKDFTRFLTALCTCCVLAVLPKTIFAQNPIIKLSFDEASGVAPLNSGTASATFVRSNSTPVTSTNAPLQDGNVSSLDFGVTPGNYFVESSIIIPEL